MAEMRTRDLVDGAGCLFDLVVCGGFVAVVVIFDLWIVLVALVATAVAIVLAVVVWVRLSGQS